MKQKVVVVGAVAAGPKAAVRVKRLNPDADVLLIDQDNYISYGGCGIPYYVSGDVSDEVELRSTSYHIVRDEAFFENAKGVRTMTRTKALAIDRSSKTVLVENLDSGEQQHLPYDKLMLATGSEPFILPIPGAGLNGVFTVNDLHKAIAIKDLIAKGKVGSVAVIGGGAIGIEMAEACKDLWGLDVSLVEFKPHLLPNLVDWEMAEMLTAHLRGNGVQVHLNEAAEEIIGNAEGWVTGLRTNRRTIDADLVLMAAGVRPRSQLARDAGLNISRIGAIVVNEHMQTSDPDIYAAGDCVELTNLVSGGQLFAPLGSLANKEGRVAGDNIAGIPSVFRGGVGSFIMKAFETSIGSVGLTLAAARAAGYDADISLTSPSDRAHFFPTQAVACFLLVFDRRTRQVLGLQGFGAMGEGILARINAAAPLLCAKATIEDFNNVEMAYSPPFSSAIDALNAAAYSAENICDGRMRKISIRDFLAVMASLDSRPDLVFLDVRHMKDAAPYAEKYGADRWLSIPFNEVRQRCQELPRDKSVVIICDAGSRSYETQLFLEHAGFAGSLVLAGGMNVLRRMNVSLLD